MARSCCRNFSAGNLLPEDTHVAPPTSVVGKLGIGISLHEPDSEFGNLKIPQQSSQFLLCIFSFSVLLTGGECNGQRRKVATAGVCGVEEIPAGVRRVGGIRVCSIMSAAKKKKEAGDGISNSRNSKEVWRFGTIGP